MTDFIYSINEIFTEVLKDDEKYYIAPYQRGYKWKSTTKYDQVPQLLIDIYKAYIQETEEYYLQYITVKGSTDDKKNIEVLDGQQRLTTLSLLFYVAEGVSKNTSNFSNIAFGKLKYSRHESSESPEVDIFEEVIKHLKDDKLRDNEIETQNMFYLVRAARCIQGFLGKLLDTEKLSAFLEYLKEHVKIILNRENDFSSSEDIFANLNDNKVALTNSYLIKGLLLTLAGRNDKLQRCRTYKEIVDKRTIMGRNWDEISSWFNKEEVCVYFFKDKNGMEEILNIALEKYIASKDKDDLTEPSNDEEILNYFKESEKESKISEANNLFNRFDEEIRTPKSANEVLDIIKHIYRKFKSIYDDYEDSSLYNLLGYVLFSEGVKYDIKNIIDSSYDKIREDCEKFIYEKIFDKIDIEKKQEDLAYRPNNPNLKNLLLAFSVFPEDLCIPKRMKDTSTSYRFDFYAYYKKKWTFEHIYPQHPEAEITVDPSAIPSVCKEIKNNVEIRNKESLIDKIQENKKIKFEDISYIYGNIDNPDVVGNMALLTGGSNSALSNNLFITKRKILYDKINHGEFVPQHTINVFSKVLDTGLDDKQFNPNLFIWGQTDIDAHTEWMKNRFAKLKNEFVSKNDNEKY